jgi:hypothetical protein
LQYIESETWSLRTVASHRAAWVPPFRAGVRDRTAAQVDGVWRIADRVRLDASVDYLVDYYPVGRSVSGPGDVRLGVWAALFEHSNFVGGAGWRVKLPNAADDAELGTDEVDVSMVVTGGTQFGDLRVAVATGLALWGDPIRYSSQDDALIIGLDLAHPVGALRLRSSVGGTLGTARNPARMEAELGLGYGCQWRIGSDAIAGLTAAAPRYGFSAWVGLGPACD